MNSVILYGGLNDWIMFYALSAIFHPYYGGMFQAMSVIICIKNIERCGRIQAGCRCQYRQ